MNWLHVATRIFTVPGNPKSDRQPHKSLSLGKLRQGWYNSKPFSSPEPLVAWKLIKSEFKHHETLFSWNNLLPVLKQKKININAFFCYCMLTILWTIHKNLTYFIILKLVTEWQLYEWNKHSDANKTRKSLLQWTYG